MPKNKITDEALTKAVSSSTSVMGVLRTLGLSQAGGSHHYYKNRIKRLELDISHFTGQSHNKGKTPKTKKEACMILFHNPDAIYRQKNHLLTRALIEIGIPYECAVCQIYEYNNKPLVLEIDHINRDWKDNRSTNLRFLCPNCHSQTIQRKHNMVRVEGFEPPR